MVWCAMNGFTVMVSAAGRPKLLRACIASRPAAGSPFQQAAIAAIGVPCSSVGRNGAGGAMRRMSKQHSSSGAAAVTRRNWWATSRACAIGYTSMPHNACGPCGCARNSNEVTAPKLPPPPRNAQNRSGFWPSLAAALAVGRDDIDREQIIRRVAALAGSPAEPAPHGESGHSGLGNDAARNDQAERLGFVVDVAPDGARLGPDDPAPGVDMHAAAERHVDHQAAVAERGSGDVVAAAADRH